MHLCGGVTHAMMLMMLHWLLVLRCIVGLGLVLALVLCNSGAEYNVSGAKSAVVLQHHDDAPTLELKQMP
jgi:hypothetical protein